MSKDLARAGTEALDPEGFARRVAQFLEWMRVQHYSEATVENRIHDLRTFVSWCAERGLARPSEVTKPHLERYQASLFHRRKGHDGRPLALITQCIYLTAVRVFFKWLARQNLILYNPAADLVLPRIPRRLPKHVLTAEEAERILNLPDVGTALGVRDRAMLETLYSTGMRRMELVALGLLDLDRGRGTVMIRQGKGRRQRVVPIGGRALSWIEKYVEEVRPILVVLPDEGVLFLTHQGRPFGRDPLTALVRGYVRRSEVPKEGSTHLFRHTCATLMLEGGADVRYVQEMLGHALLNTTQIYTRVSIEKLKEVHAATHPADLLPPGAPSALTPEASAAPSAEATTPPSPEAAPPPSAGTAASPSTSPEL